MTDPFSDPAMVARYAQITPTRVPGFADLHRMALILLSEHTGDRPAILVLGAGGGLEIRAFAQARPDWSFVGVDPSQPMLDLAARVVTPPDPRIRWVHGEIGDAPAGPFDGATCFLTLHFLTVAQRRRVLAGLRQRMKSGGVLVVAHHGDPQGDGGQRWLARSAAFAGGQQPAATLSAVHGARGTGPRLTLLTDDEERALLHEAGFSDVALFYAGLSFRGWTARACQP